MAVSFVAATSAVTSGLVASVTPAYASTTSGDLLLIFAAIQSTTPTFVDPTGFTVLPANGALDESTTLRTKAWYRKADGSESGTVSVAWTGGTANAAVIMVALRGQDPTTPLDGSSITGGTTTTTSRTNGSYANAVTTGLEVCVFADRQASGAQSWTPPAGFTKRIDVGSASNPIVSMMFCDQQQPSLSPGSQTVAARTATSAQSGTAFVSWHFDVSNYITATSELLDYSNAGPSFEGMTDARIWAELDQDVPVAGPDAWPASGQGWPRRRMVAGTPAASVPYASQAKTEVD